uniref:Uncharacterized protein n=1 Tax=Arundo donax TaxID=35708 RepID=A0A0A9EE22_ARUDO
MQKKKLSAYWKINSLFLTTNLSIQPHVQVLLICSLPMGSAMMDSLWNPAMPSL